MPVFVLLFLLFFSRAEVPALRPEIPAPGSSGHCLGISGLIFHLSFSAKSFRRFSLEGFRNFALEVSPGNFRGAGISGPWSRISGLGKIWLSLLRFSLGWGSGTLHRRFAPEISGAPEVPV